MKAAILWELHKDLEIRDDVTLTTLNPGEVHVKIASSGVCHRIAAFESLHLGTQEVRILHHHDTLMKYLGAGSDA